jgi:ATPase subunit of ABC transporter with duplicated ATPase domains
MIRFEDVTFAYEKDKPVLSGISFEIQSGETVGLIGANGAGKSTIMKLLLRSMDRAEELYASMLLRGYHGEFYYAQQKGWALSDGIYAAVCCALFLLTRFMNLTQLMGAAVVR